MYRTVASLILLFSAQAANLPPENNMTWIRIRNIPRCTEAQCVLQRPEQEANNCSATYRSFARLLLDLHSSEKISTDFLEIMYARSEIYYCHAKCTLPNLAKYLVYNHLVQVGYAESFTDPIASKALCPPWTPDYCKWWSRHIRLVSKFALCAIPVTFLLNWVNLSTLKKLMSAHKTPGAAMYLHGIEVYTDVLLCVTSYLGHLSFYDSLSVFTLMICYRSRLVSLRRFFSGFLPVITFLNQRAILNLLTDRLKTLADPTGYNAAEGKSIARRMTLLALLSSGLLYLPYILFYTFYPLLSHWLGDELYDKMITYCGMIYSLPPMVCLGVQMYKGYKYERAYHAFLKKKADRFGLSENELKEIKRNETEKRALLGGTLGLNLVTGCINTVMTAVANPQIHIGYAVWWEPIVGVFELFLTFVNGTASFIVHIVLLKQYREAFLQTAVGKLISKIARAIKPEMDFMLLSWVCFLLVICNPMVNVLIYHIAHKNMRTAVHGLLNCKMLPPNIDMWPEKQSQKKKRARPQSIKRVQQQHVAEMERSS